jgi:Fe(3+) dicitrate transport protein
MRPILPSTIFALALLSIPARADDKAQDLTVVGSKESETAGSVHSLKKKALERFKYDDPHRVLLQVPGVYARGEDGLGLRPNIGMRGANSDRSKKITLMEDSVLIAPAPYSAPAAYYFPLIQRMRTVRVIKGPASIFYGPQTIGGAIDMISEDIPATPSGMFDAAYGSYGYTKLFARHGLSSDTAGLLIEGIHVGTSGFKTLDYNGDADTGFLRREWMLKGLWTIYRSAAVTHDLGIKGMYSDETSNETYLGLSDGDFRDNPNRRYVASKLDHMKWHRTSIVLTHRMKIGDDLEIVTNAYRHDMHRIWRKVNGLVGADISNVLSAPDVGANRIFMGVLRGDIDSTTHNEAILIGPNDRTYASQGVQTTARYTVKRKEFENRLEYGVRLHNDSIIRLHTQDSFLMRNHDLVSDGRPTQTTTNNTGETTAVALYAADAFAWKNLVVTPGVRFELFRSTIDDRLAGTSSIGHHGVVLPGIGAYYAVHPNAGVLAGVHRGFSPPAPGANTKPEDSINWEGGVRVSGKKLRAEILGFFNDYQNLTNICTFSGGCSGVTQDKQFDAGGVWVYGGEAFAETEVKTDFGVTFPGRVAYTYTRSEFLTDFRSDDPQFGNVRAGNELPYVPRNQLSLTLGAETKRWGVNGQLFYVSSMHESGDASNTRVTDPYTTIDLSGYFRVTKWLQVYANVRNLTDEKYLVSRRPFGARPGAPRWIQAGLKIDL